AVGGEHVEDWIKGIKGVQQVIIESGIDRDLGRHPVFWLELVAGGVLENAHAFAVLAGLWIDWRIDGQTIEQVVVGMVKGEVAADGLDAVETLPLELLDCVLLLRALGSRARQVNLGEYIVINAQLRLCLVLAGGLIHDRPESR